jgi:hypothetical protein
VILTPEGAVLTLRARYPGSDRAYTGVTLAVVTGGRTTLTPPGIRVAGAESVLLLTRVRRHTGELDTVAEAQALRELLPDGGDEDLYGSLLERHLDLHRTAYRRVSLTLDADADDAERALPGSELLKRPKSPHCSNGSSRPAATTCCPPPGCCRRGSRGCGPATGTRRGPGRSPRTPTSICRPRRPSRARCPRSSRPTRP